MSNTDNLQKPEQYPEITVFGMSDSICTRRVLILLEELKLKYNIVTVDLKENEQKIEAFCKLQPFGKIPVVMYQESVDSEKKILFESRTILRYFSNKYDSKTDLYPDVNADLYLEVESQNFNPPASGLVYELTMCNPDAVLDQTVVDKHTLALEKVLDIYNDRLRKNKYLAGSTFTMADLSHIPCIEVLINSGKKELFKSRKYVYHWWKKISSRPSVKSTLL